MEYQGGLVKINCHNLWQIVAKLISKEEESLKKQKSLQIVPLVAKNHKVDSNIEIENTMVDFNTLNYSEEIINRYDTGDESEWESTFSTDISKYDSLSTVYSPQNIFAVLKYLQ